MGINGADHRRFLNDFYTGRFAGSFASGLPFQENPRTGDARISGSLASLAGLERALRADDSEEIDLAIGRICLLHAIIFSIGGIPLIYLGDEVGWLNDYAFGQDPAKSDDSRWVHRPVIDWAKMARRSDSESVEGRIFARLRHLIAMRKSSPALAGTAMDVIDVGNDHLFAYIRTGPSHDQRIIVVANFSEHEEHFAANELRLYGLGYEFRDLVAGSTLSLETPIIQLKAYQVIWLAAPDHDTPE